MGQLDAANGDPTTWILGPKAEGASTWRELLLYVFDDYVNWRRNYFPEDPPIVSRERRRQQQAAVDAFGDRLDSIVDALKADVPWYHPRYIAHMNSELTMPAILGYFAGLLYNPNNVTPESAPVTVRLEIEVGRMVAEMLGLDPARAWAHVTSGGTLANLEALWAARAAQFVPLALRELAGEASPSFEVELPDGERAPLAQVDDDRMLVQLHPEVALGLPGELTRALVDDGVAPDEAGRQVVEALAGGSYGIARRGFADVAARLGLRPRILVSSTAHYSIRKAANVLGYGEDAVVAVPIDERFRVSASALESELDGLGPDEYVACVIGVVGSTEEGAVDPLHEVVALRRRWGETRRRSFWVHADAAYGGYVASVLRGLANAPSAEADDQRIEDWISAVGAIEPARSALPGEPELQVAWNDPDVYAALLALGSVDSVTIDPHKLGYVPYPAGMVAFRDRRVTNLLARRAAYLSEFGDSTGPGSDSDEEVHAVGPFILEGSKPGAAAAACWLAHKAIPLDAGGHGRLVRATLLSAAKLAHYLDRHAELYERFAEAADAGAQPFTFTTITEPDTNIVCFVAVPLRSLEAGQAVPEGDLGRINDLTRAVHAALGPDAGAGMPYRHPFFVSRTDFERTDYSAESLGPLLDRLGVTREAYLGEGLFVLRSVVMNPLYQLAEQEGGKDYLFDFVRELHAVGRRALDQLGAR